MRVDVANLFGLHARIAQRLLHHANRARPGFVGHRQMKSVGGHAVADDLGVNARAASLRKFQFFENHDAGALADNKAVAIAFKGTRGMLRIIVARRQRAHRGKPRHAHRRDGRLSAAANHDVGIAALNDLEAVADGVRARRAGSGRG